jgi:uncharacterized membrane protein
MLLKPITSLKGGFILKNLFIRFKSWAVWVSIGAMVVFCVKEFAGVDISSAVDGFLNVLLPLLVAFGIVNNPTDNKHF